MRDGSPVRNTGHVIFAEEATGDSVLISYSQDWIVTNTSLKPIVAIIESLSLILPNGYRAGGIEQYELFFRPALMQPGDELSFSRPAGGMQRTKKLNSVSVTPQCQVTVLWVQFADGSTFGDPKYGASLLADRRKTLNGLVRLRDSEANEGSASFLKGIQGEGPSGATFLGMYLAELRDSYKRTGNLSETFNKLKGWLDTAQSRQPLAD